MESELTLSAGLLVVFTFFLALLARTHYLFRYFAYLMVFSLSIQTVNLAGLATNSGSFPSRIGAILLAVLVTIVIWFGFTRLWDVLLNSNWLSARREMDDDRPSPTSDSPTVSRTPTPQNMGDEPNQDITSRLTQWRENGYPVGNWKLARRVDSDERER